MRPFNKGEIGKRLILFARMDAECAPEQEPGYLSQSEGSEFCSETFPLGAAGLLGSTGPDEP